MSEREQHSGKPAPKAVVGRVGLYLRQLESFRRLGKGTASSREVGDALNLTDAQVRKDLAFFGQFGFPGVGYRIDDLASLLRGILGVDRVHAVALVGVGNLGKALLKYRGFRSNGFEIAALFDKAPKLIGQRVEGLEVRGIDEMPAQLKAMGIAMAMFCVPAEEAQAVADLAVSGGVLGILNFAPIALAVPATVEVVDVDLSIHLERLAYHVQLAGGRGPETS